MAYQAMQKIEKDKLAATTATSRATRSRSRSQSPGVTQAFKSMKKKGQNVLMMVEEEEEGSGRAVGTSKSEMRKRGADGMDVDDAPVAQNESPKKKARIVAPPTPSPPPVVKTSKATNPKVKGNGVKAAKVVEDPRVIQLKVSKRKGGEVEAEMAAEFNALKLVKPTYKPMVAQKGTRMDWGDDDEEEENIRLIREDQKARWDDDTPREPGFFRIVKVTCGKTVFTPREVDETTRARWATQVDLKGFRVSGSPFRHC